jgi:hypothetical protein
MNVHPVLPESLKPQQLQLPRSRPDGPPVEISHLGATERRRAAIGLVAGLAIFPSAAHAHDRWDSGGPVPVWVKTECCGPSDAHHLRPDQVKRNADGDYLIDINPDPIPACIALPSQDGDYWLFFYNDYGFYGSIRCFFVPALFLVT